MRSLFFRLYLFVTIMIIGLGWSLERLYDEHGQQSNQTTDVDLHKGTLFLINRELARHAPEEELTYIKAIGASFGYPISLESLSFVTAQDRFGSLQLTPSQVDYLREGGIVTLYDDFGGHSWFLQKRTQSQQVLVLGPIVNDASTQSEAIFTTLFLCGLALVIFIWVWPISKGLVALTKAAEAFGRGEFDTRVDMDIAAPLEQVATRFNAMAARIQRLIKSHKELSHAVSHELRTPIARIRFAMEMAREVKLEESRLKYLDTMDENIVELDGLVDELLTYARFDREEPVLAMRNVNIVELVDDLLARYRMTNTELTFAQSNQDKNCGYCVCDEDAMVRVLDNLVRNAVRYAKTTIEINVKNSQAHCEISVCDDGPGIPSSSWDKLFEPFVRLDQSRDRNSGGIGLGLAIVKRYIELHNGHVSIAQANIGGAKFCISLPSPQNNTFQKNH